MAVGLDADSEALSRSGIPSGGAGTLSGGGFTDFLAGVWCYRPSAGNAYTLTADGSIIHCQAGARELKLGFDNTFGAGLASSPLLQVIFNSGGGALSVQTFASANFLDEHVFYFFLENATDGHIAGYIKLSDLATAITITRANDNAGSQYINVLTFGNTNAGAGNTVVMGNYAYGRAQDGAGFTVADALALAASSAPDAGDWGFWPMDTNADNVDDSGNGRDLTFTGTLTSETSPTLGTVAALKRMMMMGVG